METARRTTQWCRREVIDAKRRLVPMIVVDCLRDIDPLGMAYLGNVPVVRRVEGYRGGNARNR